MRLTLWTDYSLRVLMYCAACTDRAQPVTIVEIARAHGISRHHLTKVVMMLAALGYVETTRGRGGGLRLLVAADRVTVGEVLRRTETDLRLLECFDAEANTCRLDGQCRLQCLLQGAMARFLETMDACTLADLVTPGVRGLCQAAAGSQAVALPTARSAPVAGSR